MSEHKIKDAPPLLEMARTLIRECENEPRPSLPDNYRRAEVIILLAIAEELQEMRRRWESVGIE